jgi:hypothetical protein
MQVVVTCCGCSRQLRLPSEVIGQKGRCPLCKVVFITRSLGNDRAEALPVAEAPAKAPQSRDEPDLLPLDPEAAPRGLPNLSLDEPEPPPRKPAKPQDAEPADDLPLKVIDEDEPKPPRRPAARRRPETPRPEPRRRPPPPPREEEDDRDEEAPPRRTSAIREEDDEEDEDEAPPPRRRREGVAFVSFPVFVHSDPDGRLSGRFEAEIDADGLKMWRGKGRVLEVPQGAGCEYMGEGRLLLPIDGRKVELSTIPARRAVARGRRLPHQGPGHRHDAAAAARPRRLAGAVAVGHPHPRRRLRRLAGPRRRAVPVRRGRADAGGGVPGDGLAAAVVGEHPRLGHRLDELRRLRHARHHAAGGGGR